ncbi:MAG TPA: succinate dehydrogenase, hydrophobic membrane anchor protein [Casimicrobiaceae bacterium]|jgi:succinate dehydrogenase / fumarate reductase membrane anchor subunit
MVIASSYEAASAHYGWRDWLSQRVTAVVMLVYTLLIFAIVIWNGGVDYAVWKSVFANHAFKLATFLFMIALAFHAWVGVRNILMDYIKPTGWRLSLQTIVICVLIAYLGWTIEVLWGAL